MSAVHTAATRRNVEKKTTEPKQALHSMGPPMFMPMSIAPPAMPSGMLRPCISSGGYGDCSGPPEGVVSGSSCCIHMRVLYRLNKSRTSSRKSMRLTKQQPRQQR